jgi:hypothetical protein
MIARRRDLVAVRLPLTAPSESRGATVSALLTVGLCVLFTLPAAARPARQSPAPSAGTPAQAGEAASSHAKKMGNRIMCMCGGCEDTAGSCNHTGGAFSGPCPTALGELKELDERIGKGESDDLVLQDFVQEYGPQVLVVPPARGFNLAAWIMPVAVALVGFLLALMVVRRWRGRALRVAPAGPDLPVRPELIARARAETDNEDF